MDKKIVVTTSHRLPAKFRGALSSADYNDFQENVINDIHNLGSAVNTLSNQLSRLATVMDSEVAYIRSNLDKLLRLQDYMEVANGSEGYLVNKYIDFSDTTGISFPGGTDDSFSAMVSATFGEATVPINSVENKFYSISVRDGKVLTSPDINITVTSTFDKDDGAGLVDYEKGGTVYPGVPENAFNGNNRQYWIRRVEFPLNSRVDEVEVEMTVDVPSGGNSQANLIEIFPFPNGSVDLMVLASAPDLTNTFIDIDGFEPVDNLVARRYHFPVRTIERLKIRLRQRNWIEENGRKVFYYGLQELGLKLVDYDKSYDPTAEFGKNHSFVVKMTTPEGVGVNDIFNILPEPNFLKEDQGSRHVRVRIAPDESLSSWLWDSDSSLPPQDSGSPVNAGGAKELYFAIEMKFVDKTGGDLSPYLVGTPAFLKGIGLTYNMVEL